MKKDHCMINFDKWAELAKTDPIAFEKLRSQFLTNALSRIAKPKRHQFECLQWRIDTIRQTTKNPLFACIKISQLMWSSFEELNQKYNDDYSQPAISTIPQKTATILPFHTQN